MSTSPPSRPSAEWVALGGAREDLDALQAELARIAADVIGEALPLPADRCAAPAATLAARARLPLANTLVRRLEAYLKKRRPRD